MTHAPTQTHNMTRSLLERWCPEPHAAPISAAVYDPTSGHTATLDTEGVLAVCLRNSPAPAWTRRQQRPGGRALTISRGGQLVAVGDDEGRLAVLRCEDGAPVLLDDRPGDAGAHRAVQAVALSPDASQVATLSADGRIRIVDIRRGERVATFSDFAGEVLVWDPTGNRIVAGDRYRQPTLIHLQTRERTGFPLIPGGAQAAAFVMDGRRVAVIGEVGIHLVDIDHMEVLAARNAGATSSLLGLVIAPDGRRLGVITPRSVHYLQIDGLRPTGKESHTAVYTTGAAVWDAHGVSVADDEGRMRRVTDTEPLSQASCVAACGPWRAVGHQHQVALWRDHARQSVYALRVGARSGDADAPGPDHPVIDIAVDPEGSLLAVLPEGLPLHVYDGPRGHFLFAGAPDTVDSPRVEAAVGVVGCLLEKGGLRWYDLRRNREFELEWARDFALTGGGTWLAVLSARGRVRIMDPSTGEDALPALPALSEAPIRLMSFVHRRPELLALDEQGALLLVDLEPLARDGAPPLVHRIAAFRGCDVDALWGLRDGRAAVARVQEPDGTSTLVTIDLDTGEAQHVVAGRLPYATVDPDTGRILEPAIGNAIVELLPDGAEATVLRSLPRGEWLAFDHSGVVHESAGAAAWRGEARARRG